MSTSPTRYICFYSYKGGNGRSLILANVAYWLAYQGKKMLIMDMDMEAPGQHRTDLFHEETQIIKPGLLEMLLERKKLLDSNEPFFIDIKNYVRRSDIFDRDISRYAYSNPEADSKPVPLANSGGIDLLPVSQAIDEDYQAKLAQWDWEEFYSQYNGEDFLQELKQAINNENYDAVLIDSRTGISEVFFVTTFSLAETVVLVSGLNRQNIEGTRLAASTLLDDKRVKQYGKKNLRLVFSPIPSLSSNDVNNRIKEIDREWPELKNVDAFIPYQPQLAITESIIIRDDLLNQRIYKSEYSEQVKNLCNLIDDFNEEPTITPFSKSTKLFENLNSSNNPFLAARVEYLPEEQVATYFVDPGNNISQALQQFMPTVLFGSRGTGKTMLARWLSYETLAYRLEHPHPKNIQSPIGLWFRLDIDLLNAFNTKDEDLQGIFNRLFGQFFDLLVLRKALEALKALGGMAAWCNPAELYKVLVREMGDKILLAKTDLVGYPQSDIEMSSCIEQRLADLRAYINNPEKVEQPYLIQDNILMKLLVEFLLTAKSLPEQCYFIAFIDEFENFKSYQQRIVNTRAKQIKYSDRITYKLLARNGSIHSYESLSKNQSIEVTHDFRSYNLDEGVEFTDFKPHVKKIIEKYLNESRYFRELECLTVGHLFAELSAEDEAFNIAKKRGSQPLHNWLKQNHKHHDLTRMMAWMERESNVLRQAVAVVLLNQGKPLDKIVDEFVSNTSTARDWYHNYHRGALHWLCSLYKKQKHYAGINDIVGIAGNNIRVALDLCCAIIETWLAEDNDRILPISSEIQNYAIHTQSETYFRALRDRLNGPLNFHRFVERLGRLFEIIHKGPKQGEPEINHFIIDGELDKESENFLSQCRAEAVLRWLPGNKQKGKSDQQQDAWQLHPRYTPHFEISWRRKKMLRLTAVELAILFKGNEGEWKKVVKRVDQQYCQLKSISAVAPQNSLFDENYD